MKDLQYFNICILFIAVFSFGCNPKSKTQLITDISQITAVSKQLDANEAKSLNNCGAWENYTPSPENSLWFEEEHIRLNFHAMYDSKGDLLLPFDHMKSMWLPMLIDNAHQRFKNAPQMNLPEGNNTPVYSPMIKYVVVASDTLPEAKGYYAHIDDDLAYYINKGKDKNNYKKDVIKKYAIDDDSILNVFVMEVHPDSVASKTYKQHNAGIALGTSVKISGFYEEDPKWWEYASTFNHEVGHIFGLKHAWNKYDGCEDTPVHPNCFQRSSKPPCDGPISNNLMDYNNERRAITPCQLGIYHRTIHNIETKQRRLIVERWCTYQPDNPIIITEDTHWIGDKDLSRDIIIEDGTTMTISCRISMAESAKIIVKKGGHLILDGVRLHNDCGQKWGGIEVQQPISDCVSYRGTNSIENTITTKV